MKKLISTCIAALLYNYALAQHYIIFHAYPASDHSLAGHAFVSFITKDQSKQQTIVDAKWGFRPAKNSSKVDAFFVAVSDNMKEDWVTTGKYDFVVKVERDEVYKRCLQVKDIWDDKNYSLVASQTCVDFIRDIAYRIPGVVIPPSFGNTDSWQWPKDFLLALKRLNPKIDVESRKSLSEITPSIQNEENFDTFRQRFFTEQSFQLIRLAPKFSGEFNNAGDLYRLDKKTFHKHYKIRKESDLNKECFLTISIDKSQGMVIEKWRGIGKKYDEQSTYPNFAADFHFILINRKWFLDELIDDDGNVDSKTLPRYFGRTH